MGRLSDELGTGRVSQAIPILSLGRHDRQRNGDIIISEQTAGVCANRTQMEEEGVAVVGRRQATSMEKGGAGNSHTLWGGAARWLLG